MNKVKNLNPYLSGVLLGLVLLATFYISGRGLGASGAFKSTIAATTNAIAPSHTETAAFYQEYMPKHEHPMKSWLVYQVFGVILGGLISGAIFGRLKVEVQKGPRITNKKRIIYAIIGGALFGFGAQLGRGCTSGSALTGMANISAAGFLSMMMIFGGGYIFAYFFRKNWI